jgi:hypothetical protein
MDLNLGYDALYGMYRSLTKIGRSLMCRYLIMIYVSFMLD